MRNPKPAILVAATLGIAGGIIFGLKPWRAYLTEREETAAVREELTGVRKERAALEREAAEMRSEGGKEERARKEGYSGKGEVPIPR